MNTLVIVLTAAVVLVAAYALYGRWLAKTWGIDPKAQTPAVKYNDGKDFVPTNGWTVFSHQFSSIAGAGPVTGAIQAAAFGWLPVLLWVLLGGVFFGAVTDFGALYASVKNDGKSMCMLIEKYIGKLGRKLFLLFCWLFCLIVIAAFADMVAGTFNAYTVADDCPPDFGDSKYCAENYDGSPNGWFDENGVIVNRPNATILDVPEGLVIESGKPFDFHGYVDAYNEHISQMEFSFDGGETWTAFDLADTDPNRVVWWHLQWTPPEQGAYRLTVRATTAEGSESKQTHTVLVNAKDVLPSKEDTVVLETTSLVPPRAAAAGGQN